MANLGERIRVLREQRSMSRKELADSLGLSEIFIRKVEAGDRVPSLHYLEKIAHVLHAELRIELVAKRARRKGGSRGR